MRPLSKGYAYIFHLLFCQAGMNSHHPIGIQTFDVGYFFLGEGKKKLKTVLKLILEVL